MASGRTSPYQPRHAAHTPAAQPAPPRRSGARLTVLLVVLLLVAGGAAAVWWFVLRTADEPSAAPPHTLAATAAQQQLGGTTVEAPSGAQAVLTATLTLPLEGVRVEVDIPAPSQVHDAEPSADGQQASAIAPVGAGDLALFLTDFGPAESDAVIAVEQLRRSPDMQAFDCTPVERLRVADAAGARTRCTMAQGRVLDEYRVVRDGRLVGLGWLGDGDDPAVTDTALAVLHSWRWVES